MEAAEPLYQATYPPMTNQQILHYAQQYTMKWGEDRNAAKEVRFWALYLEVPGAIALGPTADAAQAELKTTIADFLRIRLDHGGTLPTPLVSRSGTAAITSHTGAAPQPIRVEGIVFGSVEELK